MLKERNCKDRINEADRDDMKRSKVDHVLEYKIEPCALLLSLFIHLCFRL